MIIPVPKEDGGSWNLSKRPHGDISQNAAGLFFISGVLHIANGF